MLPASLMNIEDRIQGAVARALIRIGRPVHAYPLPGIVLDGVAHVDGRVLVRRETGKAARTQSTRIQLLRANLAPFFTAEVPNASVRVQLGDRYQDVVTDREGYFTAIINAADLPAGHLIVTTTPLDPPGQPLQATVHNPDPNVDFAVVSDIDDTIIDSGVAHGAWTTLKTVLLSDGPSRVPLDGAAALYQLLAKAADGMNRPFVYLSTSPWNLANFLETFLERHKFPSGPLVLTDWGFGSHGRLRVRSYEHKLDALRKLAVGLPRQRFILLGDSGQVDAEIYAAFVAEHPGRVAAVYIRSAGESTVERVRRLDESAAVLRKADVPFLLADDSDAMLRHAQAAGFVFAD